MRTGKYQVLRGASACAVLAFVLASCSGGGGGSDRSTESFCDVLAEGAAELDATTASSESSVSGQLGMILSNIADYTRLLHRLDEVAPNEISSDMHDVRKAWDSTADTMSKAVSDPLGALAGAASVALFTSSASEAVEDYAVTNCGQPLFGAFGGSGDPSRCPAEPGTSLAQALQRDSTPTDLDQALEDLAALGSDVALAAAELANLVNELDPEPRYALEAIGRLNFEAPDGTAALTTLDSVVAGICGTTVVGPSLLERVSELRPTKRGEAANVSSTMYGTPCGGSGGILSSGIDPVAPFGQLFQCGDDIFAVIDLETGVPRYLTAPGASSSSWRNTGQQLVWFERAETPARGLEPIRTAITLHLLDYATGADTEVPVLVDEPALASEARYEIPYATTDRVVTIEGYPREPHVYKFDVVVRDGSGKELARWGQADGVGSSLTDAANDPGIVTAYLMESGDDQTLIDLDAPQLVRPGDGRVRVSGPRLCPDRRLISVDGGSFFQVLEPTGAPQLTQLAASFAGTLASDSTHSAVVRPGVIVDGADGMRARALDGSELWAVTYDVIQTFKVVGGWLYVTNQSDETFFVDPVTGEETTTIPRDVQQMLRTVAEGEYDVILSDKAEDLYLVFANGVATRHTYASACPG